MDQKNMNLIEEQNHQVCKRNKISNFHLATLLGIKKNNIVSILSFPIAFLITAHLAMDHVTLNQAECPI